MKLGFLLNQIHPLLVKGHGDPDVKAISYDSRKVKPGTLFFALRGQHQDGNQFVHEAVDRGAPAVISDQINVINRANVISVRVADMRQAMAKVSCAFYHQPSEKLRVIGITGTNGKTTVAFMVRNILSDAGQKPGVIGTIEYQIGDRVIPAERTTPESPDLQCLFAQMIGIGCQSAVLEVSSHALVQQRIYGIDFDIAVFTNLTQDHLDYHKSMDNYFQAKALLFRSLKHQKKRALAIINLDDEYGRRLMRMKQDMDCDIITYGTHSEAAVRAARMEVHADESVIEVQSPWGNAKVSLKLLGRFNISNALAAFASCGALGVEPARIAHVLSEMVSVPGRLEEVRTSRGFHVFIDYAHTHDALNNVLSTLREITSNKLIVVFGCGGNRDRSKRPLMGRVADCIADYTILTSDNPRKENPSEIIAAIREGFKGSGHYEVIEDRRDAINKALSMACKGDVVLIAGKGHENYQELADTIIPFDDRRIVYEWFDEK